MNSFLSSIYNYFSPPLDRTSLEQNEILDAKFKEINSLYIETLRLNQNYFSSSSKKHPSSLASKIKEAIEIAINSPNYHRFFQITQIGLDQLYHQNDDNLLYYTFNYPIKGKTLFDHMQMLVDQSQLPDIDTIDAKNPFLDSDLVLFKNSFKKELPINGIYQKDLEKITGLYKDIINDKTVIKVWGGFDFRVKVYLLMQKLLTRRVGHELLESIAHPSWKYYFKQLTSLKSFQYTFDIYQHPSKSTAQCTEGEYNSMHLESHLAFNKQTEVYVHKNDSSNIITEKMPEYIELAHELIHIRHFIHQREFKAINQTELISYSNASEKVTITGLLNGKEEDPICENSIRNELGLLSRVYHTAVRSYL